MFIIIVIFLNTLYNMRILIIGAGISGLYCAYKLHLKYKDLHQIQIIEKDTRIGGRIYSKNIGPRSLELGAGGIMDTHENMKGLVNDLGITQSLNCDDSMKTYLELEMDKNKNQYIIKNRNDLMKDGFMDICRDLDSKLKSGEIDSNSARSYSLHGLLERTYGSEVADKIENEFGYDGDISEQNALNGLSMLLRDVGNRFCSFKNGYSEVIEKLHQYLVSHGIEIILETKCMNIRKTNGSYECMIKTKDKDQGYLFADHIVLAMPKHNLRKIKFLKPVRKILGSVITKPLMRVYLKFPTVNGIPWFNELNGSIVTNTMLRQIIPTDKSLGILMVYVAGSYAIDLNYLKKSNIMIPEIIDCLKKIFGTNIPMPIKSYCKFWKRAAHVWKPMIDSDTMSQRVIRPFDNENVYIVGEAYAKIQQWATGAIDSVDHFIDQFQP